MTKEIGFKAATCGALALGLTMISTVVTAQAAPSAGETLFKQRCSVCHSVDKSKPAGVGPNLAAIVGRKAGSSSFNYSTALKASPIVWTKPNLDKYLAAPTKAVPGTRMVISLTDAKQRAAVIDYLSKAK